jgi:DnaJ-class molecular chaperone
MTCGGTDLQKHKGVTLRSLGDSRIARERLKNVREDRRSTLEDCVRKNTGQKKQKCKNCEGKGTLKKGDKIVRCRRCGGTGIKP